MMPPTVSKKASASVMKRWWSANATRRVIMPTVLPSGDGHYERSGTTVRLREGRRRGRRERADKPPAARSAAAGVTTDWPDVRPGWDGRPASQSPGRRWHPPVRGSPADIVGVLGLGRLEGGVAR